MAAIAVEAWGRGRAAAAAATAARAVVARLSERGHRARFGGAHEEQDVHLVLAAEEGDPLGEAGLGVVVGDEAGDESLDLAARLHDLLPETPAEDDDQLERRLSSGFGARARCGCSLRLPAALWGSRAEPWATRFASDVADAVCAHLRARRAYGLRARSWSTRSIDIRHEVPLVPQLTGMSCWAACAAMVVGWRDAAYVQPEQIARGLGRWGAYRDGLQPADVDTLARVWGLVIEPPRAYGQDEFERLLAQHGPLWIGQADPDLHVICVVGLTGDGSADGTLVRVNDPWPPGDGERYSITLGEFAGNFRSASRLVGIHAQILHAGGRA
jgi:hypothetical protein